MSILDFPHSAPSGDDSYPTVGLPFLMRELGARNMGLPRQIKYAELLIAECGCPPPYPALVGKKGEQRLEHGVTKESQWPRKPLELWLEDFLPPANAAALDAKAAAAAAAEMDAAAGSLRLVGGGNA